MDKIEVSSTNEAGDQVVDFANFDPAREEENKINSRNAELLFNVEFIPFYLGIQREHGLSDLETKIYGFVKFFTGGGKDFFVSNQRIAAELGVKAPETISRAVRVLTDKGLIHASSKVTPAGTIRKLRVDEKVIPARRKSQGGLTKKSRGVDEKVKLYIPSNTYQVSNNISPIGDTAEAENLNQISEKKEYGNQEINQMLSALKAKIGLEAFADSGIERNIAAHCVRLMGKIGVHEFSRRLDSILGDSFKHKNCNRIKYVYSEIKGFIEPIESKIPSF
jgi:hypothetical protein